MSRMTSLDGVVIVLCQTSEPGNIGAAARAMKTMGLKRLRLVAPVDPLGPRSRALAHTALDVLEAAEVHPDVASAVADAQVVAGTTSRRRQLRKQALLQPDELCRRLLPPAQEGTVCLLFGTERTGLTNEEANICRWLSMVDTAIPQPSLNLSQAVMLYCWELRRAQLEALKEERALRAPARPPDMRVAHPHRGTHLPAQRDLDILYEHLGEAMDALGYSDFERRKFTTYLRQLHMRAGIVDWELQIYHLLARRIMEATGRPRFRPRGGEGAAEAEAPEGPEGPADPDARGPGGTG